MLLLQHRTKFFVVKIYQCHIQLALDIVAPSLEFDIVASLFRGPLYRELTVLTFSPAVVPGRRTPTTLITMAKNTGIAMTVV